MNTQTVLTRTLSAHLAGFEPVISDFGRLRVIHFATGAYHVIISQISAITNVVSWGRGLGTTFYVSCHELFSERRSRSRSHVAVHNRPEIRALSTDVRQSISENTSARRLCFHLQYTKKTSPQESSGMSVYFYVFNQTREISVSLSQVQEFWL